MEQLSGLDASFLSMETPTTFPHVAHLVICETTTPEVSSFEHLCDTIDSRLHLFPAYRRRIVEVPFGLDHPYWIEDPDFDLEYHIRELALPAPGNRDQLAEQVARICARPLDRCRPLWELYVVHGIEGDKVGLLTKVHHSAVDGMSGAEIMGILYDPDPDPHARDLPAAPAEHKGEKMPSQLELLVRSMGGIRPID